MTKKKIARSKRGTKARITTDDVQGKTQGPVNAEIRRAAERAGITPTAESIRSDIYTAEHLLASAADCVVASGSTESSRPLSQAQMTLQALQTLRSARAILVDAAESVMYLEGAS